MTALFVSPHFDDVALSCAGAVLARSRAGQPPVVCTVFSRHGDAAVDAARAAEEAGSLALAGATGLQLGFMDAPARLGVSPSFAALCVSPELEADLVAEVRRALAEVIARVQPDQIWLPLGVGGHLDHRTVFAAATGLPGPRPRFYEDRPYAFVPALRELRRLELEGGPGVDPPEHDDLRRQLEAGGCRALGVTAADRVALRSLLARPRPPARLRLRRRVIPHPWSTLPEAAALIDAHASQVRWLLGSGSAGELLARVCADDEGWWYEMEVELEGDLPA